jgi:hypothetical protein
VVTQIARSGGNAKESDHDKQQVAEKADEIV